MDNENNIVVYGIRLLNVPSSCLQVVRVCAAISIEQLSLCKLIHNVISIFNKIIDLF